MKSAVLLTALILFSSCSNRYCSSSDLLPELGSTIKFSDNSGTSFNEAIVVYGVTSTAEAFAAEHKYISQLHGRRGSDWYLIGQTLISENKKIIDVVEYRLNQPNDRRVIFFDACRFLE